MYVIVTENMLHHSMNIVIAIALTIAMRIKCLLQTSQNLKGDNYNVIIT